MERPHLNPIVSFIWKHRKTNLIIFSLSILILIIVVFIVLDKYYTATATVIPSSSNFASQLGGKLGALAGLAGINSIGAGGQTQEMYQGIIGSRRLQLRLLNTVFEIKNKKNTRKEKLIDFLDIKAKNSREHLEKAFKMLNEDVIYTEVNPDNDLLILKVTLKNPFLAADVANKIIEYLDDIVRHQINKEYSEQYNYLTNRISLMKDSILIAENNLKNFLEKTRDLNAPQNIIKQLRLKRVLTMQTAILAELKKQEEIFILENMVNLSPVKVLDHAIPPYRKSRPRRALILISFFLIILSVQFLVNYLILAYKAFKQNLNSVTD